MQSPFTEAQLGNMSVDRLLAFASPETTLEVCLINTMRELYADAYEVEELRERKAELESKLDRLENQMIDATNSLDEHKDFFDAVYSAFAQREEGWEGDIKVDNAELTKAIQAVIKQGIAQCSATKPLVTA